MIFCLVFVGCDDNAVKPVPRTSAGLSGARPIADVADQVTPSVVSILSERSAHHDPARAYDLGSGVIVSADGAIVTSSHVIAEAQSVRVALQDGRTLDARVVGSDPESDVAVLRVDATDLTPIQIGDSARLRTGDLVLAIGNPFGVGQTVTMGIVSAIGRSNMGVTPYDEFIQTDAAINPGNSGGALVDMDGQLVGINSAILSRSGGYQGIAFAIPSRMVIRIKDALLKEGKVVRGWLGVELVELTDELAPVVGVAPRTGVVVSTVTPGGPAAKAGVEQGDVIAALNGAKTIDPAQLRNLIAMTATGTIVRLDVLRRNARRSLLIALRDQPPPLAPAPTSFDEAGLFAGVSVLELDATLRDHLRVPEALNGVVISAIEPGSLARFVGFRVGDVIVAVNRIATPSIEAFHEAVGTENNAVVIVVRDGSAFIMTVSSEGHS